MSAKSNEKRYYHVMNITTYFTAMNYESSKQSRTKVDGTKWYLDFVYHENIQENLEYSFHLRTEHDRLPSATGF